MGHSFIFPKSMRVLAGWLTWIFILTAGQMPARGDGGVVPAVSYPVLPQIPSQTALIVHEAGIETLVVESAIRTGGSARVAWILPLPKEPESIGKVQPGTLGTLRFCVGPRLVGGLDDSLLGFSVFLAFLFAIGLTIRLLNTRVSWREAIGRRWPLGLKILLVLAIADGLALMATAGRTGTGTGASEMEPARAQWKRMGNYEVATVKARDRKELQDWLTKAGFAQPPEAAAKAVDEYAREGWCFLVARLDGTTGTNLTPHPLQVRFRTPEAVYPMRLTAMGGEPSEVSLFVAGRGRYNHPALETVFADQFETQPQWFISPTEAIQGRQARNSGVFFAHPELLALVPDGMWITALRGTLKPDQMNRDLRLIKTEPEASAPYRKVLYTRGKALAITLFWMMVLFTVGSPLWAGYCRLSPRPRLDYLVLPGVVLLTGAVMLLGALPTSPHIVTHRIRPGQNQVPAEGMRAAYMQVLREAGGTPGERAGRLSERLTREVFNPLDRERMREEASPGNFVVKTDEQGRLELYFFDQYGHPTRVTPG